MGYSVAMPNDGIITHAEALRLIDEQIGEKVYLALLVTPGDPEDPENPLPVFHMIAPLRNPLAPKPPRLEPDRGFYEIGKLHFLFAPMTGTIHLRDNGVDFRVDEDVSIRIAWHGSKEVGDWRPDPKSLEMAKRRRDSSPGTRTSEDDVGAIPSGAGAPESQMPKPLHSCPRCGNDHESITWQTFTRPMKRDGSTISSHWALCPDSGEPIIREVVFGEIVSRSVVETHAPTDDDEPPD
jgi:hypothetical protein